VLRAALTDLRVAARSLFGHRRRAFAGALAVAFGTMALILAAGFVEHTYVAMREGHIHSGLGHIQILRPGYLERGVSDPFAYLLAAGAPELAAVERAEHVVAVAPRLEFNGLISFGELSLSFLGRGLDPKREPARSDAIAVEGGVELSAQAPNGIHLGRGLAENLGAKVGDTVVLLVTRRAGALHGVEAQVRGVFSSPTKAYDDVAVHVPFGLADRLLDARGAHRWVVYLDETANTDAVLGALNAQLGATLSLVPWHAMADFYNKTVRLFSAQVLVMKIIIALVVILSISNTMLMTVAERINEIGTAMAIGVRRTRILSRFVMEGMLIGACGGAVGIAAAWLLARGISEVGIPMPPPPGMARGYVNLILVTPELAATAFLIACGTAALAAAFPAWKASRVVIVDALRHGR
jgi:putative ABC transport system permease protein